VASILEQIENVEKHLKTFHYPMKTYELVRMGKRDEAISMLEEYLDINPEHTSIHGLLANIRDYKGTGDPHIKKMEQILNEDHRFNMIQICDLHLALGQAYDKAKDYSTAFIHFKRGNDLIKPARRFDFEKHQKLFDELKECCNAEFLERHKDSGIKGATPIFIVGMPKTGTSLLDQILDSHKDIYGAGELISFQKYIPFRIGKYARLMEIIEPKHIKALAHQYLELLLSQPTDSKYIVNKMPSNFLQLPLIKAMFPDSKVIHTIRNPMGTCFSCYKERFVFGQDWSFDLENIGNYYNLYNNLMQHYKNAMPDYIYEVEYEDIVTDLNKTLKEVLAFLGLNWDKSCLSFYKNRRNVYNPAYFNTSQPIFTSSVNSWENYNYQLNYLKNIITPDNEA
jgi:tetratricopeptide (TPR) repeat protein